MNSADLLLRRRLPPLDPDLARRLDRSTASTLGLAEAAHRMSEALLAFNASLADIDPDELEQLDREEAAR